MKRILLLFGISLCLFSIQLNGQTLVSDINTSAVGSYPTLVKSNANYMVFTATSNDYLRGVYVSDTTDGSTKLIAKSQSNIVDLAIFDSTCYYLTSSLFGSSELWQFDLKNPIPKLLTSATSGSYSTELAQFTKVGNVIYYTTRAANLELWRTDGTSAGTSRVYEFASTATTMGNLSAFNSALYFTTNGKLWKSDGTIAGTTIVKNISLTTGGQFKTEWVIFKNALYFTNSDGISGVEIWKSDGTTAGTQLFVDIYKGAKSSQPQYFTVAGDNLFFAATDSAKGNELWKTDGTVAGTKIVKSLNTSNNLGSYPVKLIALNNDVYFYALNANEGESFWKSDGTAQGTIPLKDDLAYDVSDIGISSGNKVFFTVNDDFLTPSKGRELWKTDGTVAGTSLVKDIFQGIASSNIRDFTAFKNQVFFAAVDGINGNELWKSDGTAGGTKMFTKLNTLGDGSLIFAIFQTDNQLFFPATTPAYGFELWKSDGTTAGTKLVKDIFRGEVGSMAFNFFAPKALGNKLYFPAYYETSLGDRASQIWQSDGTESGTRLLKDISSSRSTAFSQNIAVLNNKILFNAYQAATGEELWISDGTETGTKLLKDINPTGDSRPVLPFFKEKSVVRDSILFFSADDGVRGVELWKTNGTTEGTALVADINPNTTIYSPINNMTPLGDNLFFSVNSGAIGEELWKSDGTTAGTKLVKDIRLGTEGASLRRFVTYKNALYFSADDGINGTEIWKSDGTTAGTSLFKELSLGVNGSSPYIAAVYKNDLYFIAQSDNDDFTLWKTNGTSNGTVRVKNKLGNKLITNYGEMLSTDKYLYFIGNDGLKGNELWRTDGTDTGTVMVVDLNVGQEGSFPNNFTFYKNDLFFIANDGVIGRELWRLNLSTNTVSIKESATTDIIVFPNPANQFLTVELTEKNKEYRVNVFDNVGKMWLKNVVLNSGNAQIDVQDFPTGLYFLQIKDINTNKKVVKKVMIAR